MPESERVRCSGPAPATVDDLRLTVGQLVTADRDCRVLVRLAFQKRGGCMPRNRVGSTTEYRSETCTAAVTSIKTTVREVSSLLEEEWR